MALFHQRLLHELLQNIRIQALSRQQALLCIKDNSSIRADQKIKRDVIRLKSCEDKAEPPSCHQSEFVAGGPPAMDGGNIPRLHSGSFHI